MPTTKTPKLLLEISLLLFANTGQQVFKYLILLNNVKLIFEIIPMIFISILHVCYAEVWQ